MKRLWSGHMYLEAAFLQGSLKEPVKFSRCILFEGGIEVNAITITKYLITVVLNMGDKPPWGSQDIERGSPDALKKTKNIFK